MAAISRRRESAADYTWPGYVDALTTLLMVLIFLLSIFSVAQFTLSSVLSNRENAIDTLNKQIGDLAAQLSLEKRSAEDLEKDVARLTLLSRSLQAERERLAADLAAQRKSTDELRSERDRLSADVVAQRLEQSRAEHLEHHPEHVEDAGPRRGVDALGHRCIGVGGQRHHRRVGQRQPRRHRVVVAQLVDGRARGHQLVGGGLAELQ